jgi:hypothetical protein
LPCIVHQKALGVEQTCAVQILAGPLSEDRGTLFLSGRVVLAEIEDERLAGRRGGGGNAISAGIGIANDRNPKPGPLPDIHPIKAGGRRVVGRKDHGRSRAEVAAAAIALALSIQATQILMDGLDGRIEAERRNLRVTGTLGILVEAHRRGLLDFDSALARLSGTSFYLSPQLVHMVRRLL